MLNFRISPSADKEKENLREMQSQAQKSAVENQRLREQLYRLTLIVETLWKILKDKHQMDEAALKKMIDENELERNKLLAQPLKCKGCSRPVSIRSKICVFCGEKVDHVELFPY